VIVVKMELSYIFIHKFESFLLVLASNYRRVQYAFNSFTILQVYLFISSKRIVGCLVSEPIKYGFKVIPACLSVPQGQHCNIVYGSPKEILNGVEEEAILTNANINSKNLCTMDEKYLDNERHIKRDKHESTVMHFGNVKFTRQVVQPMYLTRDIKSSPKDDAGAIFYSEVPVPVVCGVRGLWVSRSERRKSIATKLLDAMRYVHVSMILHFLEKIINMKFDEVICGMFMWQ